MRCLTIFTCQPNDLRRVGAFAWVSPFAHLLPPRYALVASIAQLLLFRKVNDSVRTRICCA